MFIFALDPQLPYVLNKDECYQHILCLISSTVVKVHVEDLTHLITFFQLHSIGND